MVLGGWFRREPDAVDEPVDGWAVARDALWSDRNACFRGETRYAVRDLSVTDQSLQLTLDRRYRGVMPDRRSDALKVAKQASVSYRTACTSGEGRPLLEQRVRDVYANPEPHEDEEGGEVTVDLGILPGPLEKYFRVGYGIVQSEFAEAGEWRSTEAARRLQRFSDAFPDARIIRLHVDVPWGRKVSRWTYELVRAADRVFVRRASTPATVWSSPPLGGDLSAYVAGQRSLRTGDLESRSFDDE